MEAKKQQVKKRLRGVRFLCERYGRSDRTIDRWVELGIIPRPQYINGYKYWDEGELDASDEAREQGAPRIPPVGARERPKQQTIAGIEAEAAPIKTHVEGGEL